MKMGGNPRKILVCFDLDFTLIDNKEGIINSFNHALKRHDLRKISSDKVERMIGLPLNQMFESVTNYDSSTLCRDFRDYYGAKGIYQVKLFSGVKEMLLALKKNSIRLGIITSKKQEMAQKLLKYLNLSPIFDFIIGESEIIKSKSNPKIKTSLIKDYPEYKFVVVGDHPNDGNLSNLLKCSFIGVLTGQHSTKDLENSSNQNSRILENASDITPDLIYSMLK
ncbi:MAG: HAD-IA family hydrolase [Candidatus Lokiarchaeota archaeon]|nr:HAD-IA family hydrolase [Candidatus Lokiarchaeota archaeon]